MEYTKFKWLCSVHPYGCLNKKTTDSSRLCIGIEEVFKITYVTFYVNALTEI